MKDLRFKKIGGDYIDDLGKYLRDYLTEYPNDRVYVGTDSNPNPRGDTPYVVAVCLYNYNRRDGVHYIFARVDMEKQRDLFTRIWKEVELAENVATYLEKELEGFIKRYDSTELMSMGYGAHQDRLVDIDLDINSNPGFTDKQLEIIESTMRDGKNKTFDQAVSELKKLGFNVELNNKSFTVLDAAVSYIRGKNYRVRTKPHAWAATCAADFQCKTKRKKRSYRKRKY